MESFKILDKVHRATNRMYNNAFRFLPEPELVWIVTGFAELDGKNNMIRWNLMEYPVVNKHRLGVLAVLTRHYGWEVNIIGSGNKSWKKEIGDLFG